MKLLQVSSLLLAVAAVTVVSGGSPQLCPGNDKTPATPAPTTQAPATTAPAATTPAPTTPAPTTAAPATPSPVGSHEVRFSNSTTGESIVISMTTSAICVTVSDCILFGFDTIEGGDFGADALLYFFDGARCTSTSHAFDSTQLTLIATAGVSKFQSFVQLTQAHPLTPGSIDDYDSC